MRADLSFVGEASSVPEPPELKNIPTPLFVPSRWILNGLPLVQLPNGPTTAVAMPLASAPALRIETPVHGFDGSLIGPWVISVAGGFAGTGGRAYVVRRVNGTCPPP